MEMHKKTLLLSKFDQPDINFKVFSKFPLVRSMEKKVFQGLVFYILHLTFSVILAFTSTSAANILASEDLINTVVEVSC